MVILIYREVIHGHYPWYHMYPSHVMTTHYVHVRLTPTLACSDYATPHIYSICSVYVEHTPAICSEYARYMLTNSLPVYMVAPSF